MKENNNNSYKLLLKQDQSHHQSIIQERAVWERFFRSRMFVSDFKFENISFEYLF